MIIMKWIKPSYIVLPHASYDLLYDGEPRCMINLMHAQLHLVVLHVVYNDTITRVTIIVYEIV